MNDNAFRSRPENEAERQAFWDRMERYDKIESDFWEDIDPENQLLAKLLGIRGNVNSEHAKIIMDVFDMIARERGP